MKSQWVLLGVSLVMEGFFATGCAFRHEIARPLAQRGSEERAGRCTATHDAAKHIAIAIDGGGADGSVKGCWRCIYHTWYLVYQYRTRYPYVS